MASEDEILALERALNETEVLRAIYGEEEDEESSNSDATSYFEIVSPSKTRIDRIKRSMGLLDDEEDGDDEIHDTPEELVVPDLKIEVRTQIDQDESPIRIVLRCLLPRGYPETSPALVSFLNIHPALSRSSIDEITRSLNAKAKTLLGTEAIMDLVEETKELCLQQYYLEQQKSAQSLQTHQVAVASASQTSNLMGRRWIWVHHITKKDRIASILQEAHEHHLGGILKHGYPGVVLVEGTTQNCDSFVKWIKADKSQEGGFGRNWGHHVRGEINTETNSTTTTTIANTMQSTDDLSVMADYCRTCGLEDEFKEYVLQHK